jgi:hypothetical protein
VCKKKKTFSGIAGMGGDCSRYLKVVCPIYYVEEAKAHREKNSEIKIRKLCC